MRNQAFSDHSYQRNKGRIPVDPFEERIIELLREAARDIDPGDALTRIRNKIRRHTMDHPTESDMAEATRAYETWREEHEQLAQIERAREIFYHGYLTRLLETR